MISSQYKEKELRIMRALMKLLADGANIQEIKASDIAQAAGLGKGTLYNYFDSKEDIIARTIVFSIKTALEQITGRIGATPDFRGKCYGVMESVHEIISNEKSDFHLILFSVGGKEMKQYFGEDFSFVEDCLSFIFRQVMELAAQGREEGVIRPQGDDEYTYSAFAAALMSFVHACCRLPKAEEKTPDRAMDNAYKILLKALN